MTVTAGNGLNNGHNHTQQNGLASSTASSTTKLVGKSFGKSLSLSLALSRAFFFSFILFRLKIIFWENKSERSLNKCMSKKSERKKTEIITFRNIIFLFHSSFFLSLLLLYESHFRLLFAKKIDFLTLVVSLSVSLFSLLFFL